MNMRTIEKVTNLIRRDDDTSWLEACRIAGGVNDDETYMAIVARFPSIANYDAKGNYCGPVRHEDGYVY